LSRLNPIYFEKLGLSRFKSFFFKN